MIKLREEEITSEALFEEELNIFGLDAKDVEPVEPEGPVNYDKVNSDLFSERASILRELEEFSEVRDDDLDRVSLRRKNRAERRLDRVNEDLVKANYGMVLTYVKKFTGNKSKNDDNAQEFERAAVLGLCKAINDYDMEKGKFSTWAYKPIQREVLRAVRDADFSNMNLGDFNKRPDIIKAQVKLRELKDGIEPSIAEVAKEAEVTARQVQRVLEAPSLESLNTPLGEDSVTTIADVIVDPSDPLDELVIAKREYEDLEKYGLSVLNDKELFIIVRRYGLDKEEEQNLQSIGKMLGISREAVRQIEAKALSKISHPTTLRKLVMHGR